MSAPADSSSRPPRLRSIVFDCPDPVALAGFYAGLLQARLETSDPIWCEVHPDGPGPKLAFQPVEGYRAPEWPGGLPQQLHLDLTVEDLGDASRRAVALGAVVLGPPIREANCTFMVHADPVGHPFCLCQEHTPPSPAAPRSAGAGQVHSSQRYQTKEDR